MPPSIASPDSTPEILAGPGGARIAYHKTDGQKPGLVFLGGFMSDMTGTKAVALEGFARSRGQAFLRFDYRGHGASSGDFSAGTIGTWAADAIQVLDRLTDGPQVLIGSSMGGWIMLLAALARRQRVSALIGIAAAPDFTEDLMWQRMSPAERDRLARERIVRQPSEYGDEPYSITMELIEDGRDQLLLRGAIGLDCPVRLIHGSADVSVPWETSLKLMTALDSQDVELHLVKDGDHRLSEPRDLARLFAVASGLLDRVGDPGS